MEVTFYERAYPPISLTGQSCEKRCKHCVGIYLRHMVPAATPSELLEVCKKLREQGCEGVLLSGGGDADNLIPFQKFAKAIEEVKRLGMTINAHVGVVRSAKLAEKIARLVDAALVDVVGDERVIREVLNFSYTPQDIEESMRLLRDSGVRNITPHVIVGLDHCRVGEHEFKALEIAKTAKPETLVIVVVIPTSGTAFEALKPPAVEEVGGVVEEASSSFEHVALSCVRPGGKYRERLDEACLRAGVDKLVVPSRAAYLAAKKLGLEVKVHRRPRCCSWD